MDYFVLEQINLVQTNAVQIGNTENSDVLYNTDKLPELSNLDYIHRGCLISDRLKRLFEMYLPYNKWVVNSYIDLDKSQAILEKTDYGNLKSGAFEIKPGKIQQELEKMQEVFWRLEATEYVPSEKTVFRGSGIVKALYLSDTPTLPIFKVRPPTKSAKGAFSIIVHLSVAESMLRRNCYGVNLVRV